MNIYENYYIETFATWQGGIHIYNRIFEKTLEENSNAEVYMRLKELNSPYFPTIFAVEESNNGITIFEEYIDGIDLGKAIEVSTLNEETVIDYACQICDALIFLHSQSPPIIHRDIKPSNIIITHDKKIKIIDFDISRELNEGAAEDTLYAGTKGYAPPEQFGYLQTDCRADIYSLGAAMHELLTGKLPSHGFKAHKGLLRPIIKKCTQLDRNKRFASATALKRALQNVKRTRLLKWIILCILSVAVVLAVTVSVYAGYRNYLSKRIDLVGIKYYYNEILQLQFNDAFYKVANGNEAVLAKHILDDIVVSYRLDGSDHYYRKGDELRLYTRNVYSDVYLLAIQFDLINRNAYDANYIINVTYKPTGTVFSVEGVICGTNDVSLDGITVVSVSSVFELKDNSNEFNLFLMESFQERGADLFKPYISCNVGSTMTGFSIDGVPQDYSPDGRRPLTSVPIKKEMQLSISLLSPDKTTEKTYTGTVFDLRSNP